jgi:hypothetical protein
MKSATAVLAACAFLLVPGCSTEQAKPGPVGQAVPQSETLETEWPSGLWPRWQVSPDIPGYPGLREPILAYLEQGALDPGKTPQFCAYDLLGAQKTDDSVLVYLWATGTTWSQDGDTLVHGTVTSVPIVVVALRCYGVFGFYITEHHEPDEGEGFAESVLQLFPPDYQEGLLLTNGDEADVRSASLLEETKRRAWEYYHKLR